MTPFFLLLKRTLMAITLGVFTLTVVYVPQPWHEVPVAEAGGGSYGTEFTQKLNNLELASIFGEETVTAANTTLSLIRDNWQWLKESSLDSIAWAVAKTVLSKVTSSIVTWINSGFKGSPAFVTDLQGFLLDIADEAAGEFIKGLGDAGSFICSPFRLDVQISLAVGYETARKGQSTPSCTLTGIIDNIDGFISGLTDLSQGGWNDWFDITARPEMYTPYGAVLSAQGDLRATLVNAQGKEVTIANWGGGFLSGEICDLVEKEGTKREDCFISKPGKVIQEALTFTISGGERSLIAADEINEIIGALLGQLAQQVVTGAAGLLGLSSGTGYTASGYTGSYLDQLVSEGQGNIDANTVARDMRTAETNEIAVWNYITGAVPPTANAPLNRLRVMAGGSGGDGNAVRTRARAQRLLDEMEAIRDRNATIPPYTTLDSDGNIETIRRLNRLLEAANDPSISVNDLRDLATNPVSGVLNTNEVALDITRSSLQNQITARVAQEFGNRTFATSDVLPRLKAEFAAINPPVAGGGGGGTPVTINPITPVAPPGPPVLPPNP